MHDIIVPLIEGDLTAYDGIALLIDWRYLCLEKFRRTKYSLRGLDDIEGSVSLELEQG